jgi:transposase-like protein
MAKHNTTPKEANGPRRHFEASFKHEAVVLGKRISIHQAALDLGRNESNLRKWTQSVVAHGSQAFAALSQRNDMDAEMRLLRKGVRVLKMERDILKMRRYASRKKTSEVSIHCGKHG